MEKAHDGHGGRMSAGVRGVKACAKETENSWNDANMGEAWGVCKGPRTGMMQIQARCGGA